MNKRKVGDKHEQAAASYLLEKGHEIIERNYRCSFGEIDIISYEYNVDETTLVFTEVKYRSSLKYGSPFEAVDKRKQMNIEKTANHYIKERKINTDIKIRFDVIGILGSEIKLIENAFGGI